MNIFLSIIGFILAVAGVSVKIYTAYGEKEYGDKFPKSVKTTAQICAVVGFVVFILGASFKIVPTSYTGVRTTFGQISEQTVEKGFNLKIPFVQKIELVNNKQEDTTIEAKVWGETSEKTPVFASDIVVTSQINPEKSAWFRSSQI